MGKALSKIIRALLIIVSLRIYISTTLNNLHWMSILTNYHWNIFIIIIVVVVIYIFKMYRKGKTL